MSKLVERLRDTSYWYRPSQGENMRHITAAKAADEIERLQDDMESLRLSCAAQIDNIHGYIKKLKQENERLTALVEETRLSLVERGQEVYRMRAALREISEWRIVPIKNGPFSEQRWFDYEACAHNLKDIAKAALEQNYE